jgi:GT2 family glycosyltransferase
MSLRASVVVPTFNRAPLLPAVLSALFDQDHGDFEVVVVDDGSTDGTASVLEELSRRTPGRLRFFRQENSGPARARNRGALEARGGFLAFLDDDCMAERSWLARLGAALEKSGADAVAGAVVNKEIDWVGRYINREAVIAHVVSADGSVEGLITGNCGIRASLFRELGGFDETIRVAGGEDTEFGLRLRAGGHRIALASDARVHHESRVGLASYLRMIFRHGRGRRRLGEQFPAFRLRVPWLRLVWLAWPLREWMARDFTRYRRAGVTASEAARYIGLRYLENLVRVAGYIRGT